MGRMLKKGDIMCADGMFPAIEEVIANYKMCVHAKFCRIALGKENSSLVSFNRQPLFQN